MKPLILSLLLACSLSAAPLPPFPRAGTPRPPMVKVKAKAKRLAAKSEIVPTGAPSSFRAITYTPVDFFFCEGQPGCQLYYQTHISIEHAPAVNTVLEAAAAVTPDEWVTVGNVMPPGIDEIAWYEDKMQPQRIFRLMDVPLTATAARSAKKKLATVGPPMMWKRIH